MEKNKVSRVEERPIESEVEEDTSSSDNSIFLIRPINKVEQKEENNKKIMLDIVINGRKIETLLDTGSPISIMPQKLTKWLQPIKRLNLPREKKFVDINQNPIKMAGRFTTTAKLGEVYGQTIWWEAEGIDIPILGLDNFKKLQLSVHQKRPKHQIPRSNKANKDAKVNKLYFVEKEIEDLERHYTAKISENFKTLFENNSEVKNFKYNVNFREDFKVEQQRGRRIPIHVQSAVEKEVEKLIKEGHLTKIEQLEEDTFVSPAVIAVKSDGSVKTAMDAIQINKQIIKKKSKMPNLQELLDRISIKISKNTDEVQ